ncbi:hypothetical protein [Flavihumibacter petaseus]|uniref:Uncharacterized protein n=1 Tax=Flavihumibacter petaseus NBRC 106054 TaxID=1220578 RepID=A0A0E9MWQ5_9BACT|nr:hypothetical protein [Flavihumibacter petaseus]GAO42014.1 hypothetical protein FPE01S_01_10270 [Flavihumibacter petaseus NBRC 106054]
MNRFLVMLLVLTAMQPLSAQTFRYCDTEIKNADVFRTRLIPASNGQVHLWSSTTLNLSLHRFDSNLQFVDKTVFSRLKGVTKYACFGKFYYVFHLAMHGLEVVKVEGNKLEKITHSPLQDSVDMPNDVRARYIRYELLHTDNYIMLYRQENDEVHFRSNVRIFSFDTAMRYINKVELDVPLLGYNFQQMLLHGFRDRYYSLLWTTQTEEQKLHLLELDPVNGDFREMPVNTSSLATAGEKLLTEKDHFYLFLNSPVAEGNPGKGNEGYYIRFDSLLQVEASAHIDRTDDPYWKNGYAYFTGNFAPLSRQRLLLVDQGVNDRSGEFDMVRFMELDSSLKPVTVKVYPMEHDNLLPVFYVINGDDTYLYCEEKIRNSYIITQYQWKNGLENQKSVSLDPTLRFYMNFSVEAGPGEWLLPYERKGRFGFARMRF